MAVSIPDPAVLAVGGLIVTSVLALHSLVILGPQVVQLRRKIAQPKYAGTMHLAKLRFCHDRLRRRLLQLRAVIMVSGLFTLVSVWLSR